MTPRIIRTGFALAATAFALPLAAAQPPATNSAPQPGNASAPSSAPATAPAPAPRADSAAPAFANRLTWHLGGDFRAREEWVSDLPTAAGPAATQDYYRFRTRIFGEVADSDRWLFRIRFVNEVFDFKKPKNGQRYHFPDQLIIDNLYLEVRNLWNDRFDIRLGRQELSLGSDRLFGDGTPADGSRTFFMDMLRVTHRISPTLTADYLAIYNSPHADLTLGRARGVPDYFGGERPLVAIESTSQNQYDAGLAAYFTWRPSEALRAECYGIWKHDGARKVGPGETKISGRDVFTAGFRLLPRFTPTLSAELEGALQTGRTEDSRSLFGYMAYAALRWDRALGPVRANLFAAAYLLSGDDDPTDGRDTNWNPLWARYPQISDLYVNRANSAYGLGYWTNFFYPHLGAAATLENGLSLSLRTGYAYATQADTLGGGSGHELGWLSQAILTLPIVNKTETSRTALQARLLGEALLPGDYFAQDNWSYFGRAEILLSF